MNPEDQMILEINYFSLGLQLKLIPNPNFAMLGEVKKKTQGVKP